MSKKFLLLILLAFLVNIPVLSKTIYNPIEKIVSLESIPFGIYTTKILTEEGLYRVFIYKNYNSGGITAIKIK